jgi:hypothetical protein
MMEHICASTPPRALAVYVHTMKHGSYMYIPTPVLVGDLKYSNN